MSTTGMEDVPHLGWIKTHKKDAEGKTYSFLFKSKVEEISDEERANKMAAALSAIPAIHLPEPAAYDAKNLIAFIPINDLHAGGYAWSPETGYGNWDIDTATSRLTTWVGELINELPLVDECILFFNGDTLHTNGKLPITPANAHILDSDSRFYNAVDQTAAAIMVAIDLAAQRFNRVRVVIKRGNHDEDSHVTLKMAAKYRYLNTPNVIVDEDPSPYWVHPFGNVLLFGHHGDRVAPKDLVMKLAADHRKEWGQSKHCVVWTAHKHQREMKTFYGATWEQASCLTEPDAYGAYWGSHAMLQAVVYDKDRGEIKRFTVQS